ncbi:MAG: helix-turn-helix domain-containing protein [Dysgonamonadaceae bacterium]|nr:helix-turn-helix domain-containing protein [Dysgonamonadaceae bacterium]
MKLNEILTSAEQNRNVSVTITAGEMIDFFNHCVDTTRKELERYYATANTEKYLTIEQMEEMLGFNKSTYSRWHKSGYLKKIKIGGGIRYRLSDINRKIEEENPHLTKSN